MNYPRQAEPLAALQDNAARQRPSWKSSPPRAQALHAQARAIRAEDGRRWRCLPRTPMCKTPTLTREHVNSAGVMLRWNVLDAGIHHERAAAVAVKADAALCDKRLASQVAFQVE